MAQGIAGQMAGAGAGPENPGESLYLELPCLGRVGGASAFPVSVANLSAGGVVLRVKDALKTVDFLNLKDREAVICLPGRADDPPARIPCRVLWSRPDEGEPAMYALGLELADPDLRVRKALEDRLQAYPKDIKELWDQWDLVQVSRLLPSGDQAVYLAGASAVAAGMALYILGSESLKLFGAILAIYGCLVVAAKSVWAMWGRPTATEN